MFSPFFFGGSRSGYYTFHITSLHHFCNRPSTSSNTFRIPIIVGYNANALETAGKFSTFMVPFNHVTEDGKGPNLKDLTFTNYKPGAAGSLADQAWLWTGTGWDMYFKNTAGTWRRTTSTATFDSVYPNGLAQGAAIYFKAYAKETAIKSVTTSGAVELDDEVEAPLATGGKFAFVGNPYPVRLNLADATQFEITNYKSGAAGSLADQVWVWTGTGWDMFFKNTAGTWRRTTSTATFASAYPDGLPVGAGIYFKSYAKETATKTIVFKKQF